MKLWKVLGVAGIAGVAATGVAVARAERQRRAYEPDDVRARLHQRHQEALLAQADPPSEAAAARRRGPWSRVRTRLSRLRRSRRR